MMRNTLLKSKLTSKIFFRVFILILTICLSISFTFINANADSGYQYVKKSDGTDITYRGTNIKVEVPKTYEKKSTEFRGVWVSAFAGDIVGFTQTMRRSFASL